MKKMISVKNPQGNILTKSLVIFFLLIITVSGCKYDFVVPIPEPVPDPFVEKLIAIPESIAFNGTTTLYWKSLNVASATLNDSVISISGSKTIEALQKNTTYILKVTGLNGQVITKSVSVAVAQPIIVIPTRRDTIIGRYWMQISSKSFSDNNWTIWKLDEDQLTRKLYFYKNGFYERFKKNGEAVENGYWSLFGQDHIVKADLMLKIESLTDTTLVLSAENATKITTYKGYKIPIPN